MKIKWILGGKFPVMQEATDGTESGAAGAEPEVETPEVDEDAAFMDSLFKDEDGEEEPEPEPEKKPEPEAKPEPEPEPEQDKQEPEVEQEPEKKPEAEPEKKPEEDKKPEPEEEGKEPTQEELDAQRTEFLAAVEKDFAISEEDANLIVTEPEKVLPRLAANIYDRAMRDASQMIERAFGQMPAMMQNFNSQQQAATQAQEMFMAANPGIEKIEKQELEALVNQFAPLVTKQNPNASNEEKLKALGRTIAAVKGISLGEVTPQAAPTPKETPVQPHTPAAPVSSGEQPAPKPSSEADAFIDMLINSDN